MPYTYLYSGTSGTQARETQTTNRKALAETSPTKHYQVLDNMFVVLLSILVSSRIGDVFKTLYRLSLH